MLRGCSSQCKFTTSGPNRGGREHRLARSLLAVIVSRCCLFFLFLFFLFFFLFLFLLFFFFFFCHFIVFIFIISLHSVFSV